MSIELGAAEAVVKSQAERAGMSVEQWVLRLAAERSARQHAAWHDRNPGVLSDELTESATALAELD